ncbi:MAG: hypothetical protein ACKKMV_02600 [Candidatus Nealsonbacteria bacterium]
MDKPEEKFEKFCKNRKWKTYKIPRLPNIKTPDYFVVADNQIFIIEVKILYESKPRDRKDIEKIEINGKIIGQSGDYNKEIGSIIKKINGANQQLKTTASFNVPQILIIYSTRKFVPLNKNILLKAMYGKVFQRLRIKTSRDGSKNASSLPPLITDRTLRKDKNTFISAVAIPNNKNGMFVLHNLWANILLPVSVFNKENDINYIPEEIRFKEIKFEKKK